jgi:hypothetical protein
MAKIHLIGTIHYELNGAKRLERALQVENPDILTVEASPQWLDCLAEHWDQDIEMCLQTMRDKGFSQQAYSFFEDYLRSISNFEYEVCRDYSNQTGVPLHLIDDPSMVVKKDVFNELGLFDENYVIASDYKWVINMLLLNKKGFYLPRLIICSLDGGASSNREKCIEEVSEILFESYGKIYDLNLDECQKIYLRKISFSLLIRILFNIKNWKIKKSLIYCYFVQIKENKNISKYFKK